MKKLPIIALGLIQALALTVYITMVGFIMWTSQDWFNQAPGVLGISFFLTIFTMSALVSGLITLGYPIYLFFKDKNIIAALKLVFYTAGWLALFLTALAFYLFWD